MSLSEQTSRVANGGKDTLKAILEKMGATVPSTTKIDGYPALAAGVDNMAISAATKALYGLGSDAVPDDVLKLLGHSVQFYPSQTPKYQEVTVDLSTAQEVDIVQLPENGVLVDFYVAKLNYESTLNGAGKTLVVRKDVYDPQVWDEYTTNAWADSDLLAWLNGTYKALLGSDIQTAIGTTTYDYTPGNGNNTVTTRSDAVFLLSATELGKSESWFNVAGTALPIASTLQIAYRNGSPTTQWTRSPYKSSIEHAGYLLSTGGISYDWCNNSNGARPCFTLPSTFTATYYVDSSGNLHDEQEYDEAGSTTDVKGNPITIGAQIATGSYVGTGKYGKNNPNSLTFDFTPKAVFIFGTKVSNDTGASMMYFWGADSFTLIDSGYTGVQASGMVSVSRNIMSWYDTNGEYLQCNRSGLTYNYLAIG